ncbi:DNA alkylation repair protein [Psychromonas antarctica]|uniref:DNA alkylation repair protein n=1 Tax=Psychromonas antarctica TaxID=67573 RepID=UPI001EE7EE71|nr:DNA alkylation repair protein [Psychromonas antarctica]MCG6201983.1 DNA alkylation repair protein [Psychromonas antarctica]
MSALLKDLYSETFYHFLSETLTDVIPAFDGRQFITLIFCEQFAGYELKQRVSHTATVLHQFMPAQFDRSVDLILAMVKHFEGLGVKSDSLEYLFLPEYIQRYGINDYQSAVPAFEVITQFISCEFAVRPFIVKYEKPMLEQMVLWADHDHNRVRRLASEGSRPRLPWAITLASLKKNPAPLLPIFEQLKQDECELVRRSVANSLNDIAKDNPDFVIQFAREHYGRNKNTDRLIKHACRTLLKKGEPNALVIFGFDSRDITMSEFKIKDLIIRTGTELEFSFSVRNLSLLTKKLRLEYGLYYQKHNGSLSRKVFKISEREISPNEIYSITRKQSFKVVTTRKFYPGAHQVSIIVNGREFETLNFELIE